MPPYGKVCVEDSNARISMFLTEGAVMAINSSLRFLRINDVSVKIGISRSTIYDWMNERSPRYDPTFPKKIKIGKSKSSGVRFLECDIDEWIENKL